MTSFPFEPAHHDMSRHIASGVISTGVMQGIKILCQFGSVILLSRLLTPSDFGLMAMTAPIIAFAGLFQDLGLSQATVQKAALTHDEINAFFWINVGLGLLLSLLVAAAGPLAGWYYGDERVVALTIAMGFLVFVGAAGNQHSALLSRRMAFGTLALIDALGTVGGLGLSIAGALMFKNYWALYAGAVAATLIPTLAFWVASKWKPSRPVFVRGLRTMLKFGAGITSFNFMNFFARNLDNVLIGRAYGDRALGYYDRAYKLLLFPLQRFVWPLSGVMVPVLSRLTNEPERYRNAYLKTLVPLTLATWPGIVWAFVFSDTLIPALLGEQWSAAASIFKPLAVASLAQILNASTGWLLISQGRVGDYARLGVLNAVTCVASFAIGLPYGAVGVATAYAIGEYIRTPILWRYALRKGPVRAANLARATGPQVAGVALSALALLAFRSVAGQIAPWLALTASFVLTYAATALIMPFFPGGRETVQQTLAPARRFLSRSLERLSFTSFR